MMEYISREKAAEIVCDTVCGNAKGLCVCTPDECQQGHMKRLYGIPAADVAPVVHGWWEIGGVSTNGVIGNWKCSVCNGTSLRDSTYCPNCGAKMDQRG